MSTGNITRNLVCLTNRHRLTGDCLKRKRSAIQMIS